MAVELSSLVERAKNAVNAPGGSFFDATDPEWVAFIAQAFAWGKMHGFFAGYRLDWDTNEVVWIDDPADEDAELSDVNQTIVTLMGRVLAIENKLLEIPISVRGKAGPAEGEINRSAQVLSQLLKNARGDFDQIKDELSDQGDSTTGYVVDMFLSSSSRVRFGDAFWVN